jgi:ATP-dependent DNA helicase PIF1
LSADNLRVLQGKFRNIKYIIVDEKSMVSLRQLTWIHRRLCEIMPSGADDEAFAGVNIILVGDFFQLPPVRDNSLYNTAKTQNADLLVGQQLYRLFDQTIALSVVKRQQGDDAESRRFRQALDNLRVNKVTLRDWELLSTRVQAKLSPDEVQLFEDAIRIYAKKDDVKAFNHHRLCQPKRPVLLVLASHTGGSAAEKADTDKGGNLHKEIPISVNARIMLRENLWVERSLFNGSMGTICDIIWAEGADYQRDPPLALLVDFDDYKQNAPSLVTDPESGRVLVPIFFVKRNWNKGTVHCTRTQFPLTIAYAITIHKSQGLSVYRAVLNPGKKKDFAPGLTYVAISRVRSLPGIMFEEPFDFKRLKSSTSDITIMRATDAAKRLQQEIPVPVEEDEQELPPFTSQLSGPGRASQMEIPILPSDPVRPSDHLHSTITIPSGFEFPSGMDISNNGPLQPQPPAL